MKVKVKVKEAKANSGVEDRSKRGEGTRQRQQSCWSLGLTNETEARTIFSTSSPTLINNKAGPCGVNPINFTT